MRDRNDRAVDGANLYVRKRGGMESLELASIRTPVYKSAYWSTERFF